MSNITLASDNFTRANGGLGANWTTTTGLNAPAIVSNQAQASVTSAASAASYTGRTWNANHWAQITMVSVANSNCYQGIFLRGQTGANTNYRVYVVGPPGATAVVNISKSVAGAFTALNNLTFTLAANDVLLASVIGTTISAYQNGAFLLSFSDSSISAAGDGPGFVIGADTSLTSSIGANWSGGEFGASIAWY